MIRKEDEISINRRYVENQCDAEQLKLGQKSRRAIIASFWCFKLINKIIYIIVPTAVASTFFEVINMLLLTYHNHKLK